MFPPLFLCYRCQRIPWGIEFDRCKYDPESGPIEIPYEWVQFKKPEAAEETSETAKVCTSKRGLSRRGQSTRKKSIIVPSLVVSASSARYSNKKEKEKKPCSRVFPWTLQAEH